MNTMGKILVFVNLLFALVTGGFLAVDFATRTNWKQAYDNLSRDLEVSRKNGDELHNTVAITVQKLKKEEDRAKDLANQLKRADTEHKKELADVKDDSLKSNLLAEGAGITSMQSQEELKRLRNETKMLTQVVKDREERIIALNAERNKALDQMNEALHESESARQRSESLLERLREVEKQRAAERVASANRGTGEPSLPASVRNPSQPNPPQAYVRGTVEKVDPDDRSLLQLNVGSDSGLAVTQTLDVYRLSPQAEYLGMVRIQEVRAHSSVGRMMPSRLEGGQHQVRPGDEVSSSIQPPR